MCVGGGGSGHWNGSGFTMTKTVFAVQTRCSPSMDENFDQREGALHVLPVCTQGI